MAKDKDKLTMMLNPDRNYSTWRAFLHLSRVYDINFQFNTKGEVGFEREHFMRLMDLYALVFNSVKVDSPLYIQGFRTQYLEPGTHLLSAFIMFEDRYNISSRFDDGGTLAWFDSGEFTKLISDLLLWESYGGPMKIC
jgi:hypothetical protein